jgi:hypothetical protein
MLRAALRGLVCAGAVVACRTAAPAACVGDCSGDGTVAINELIRGVTIALGNEPPGACAALRNAQGQVTIAQLIQAVNHALSGCPADDGRLAGDPQARALEAVADVFSPDAYVTAEELSGALVRTQVDLAFRRDATVGAVNDLLERIEGRIVSSRQGVLILVVRIPDPGSAAALDLLIATLAAEPAVRIASRVHVPVPEELPNLIAAGTGDVDSVRHHLAVRAHAAWNARAALAGATPPTLVVADYFGDGPPSEDLFGVTAEPTDFGTGSLNDHGYFVLGIAAASFNGFAVSVEATDVTGMFPGSLPLRVADLEQGLGGATLDDRMLELVENTPGHAVLNTSLGNPCDTPAEAAATCNVEDATADALLWIERVRGSDPANPAFNLEGKFVHATAASNVAPSVGPVGADVSSPWNAATLLSPLVDPVSFEVVPNLTNTLVVENFTSTSSEPFQPNCIAPSSEQGGTIAAIGSPVYSFVSPTAAEPDDDGGTSAATPQVAGLAAYVWALRPGLTPAELVALLQRTVQVKPGCGLVIDAYAAVLAADEGNPARPARRAILDVTDQTVSEMAAPDGVFDEHDLALFITKLEAPDSGQTDYGRYDLNGDGRTGFGASAVVAERARVDLDLDGAYGLTVLDVEGLPLRFDEKASSDLRILCHTAYSPLYDGTDESARREQLGLGRCLDLFLEPLFPATVQPGVNNLLTIGAFDPELTDPADPNQSLGQAGVRIELDVTGGSVDDFFGITDADGIFQTNARLFDGQSELIIEVVARAGEGGPELARTTVRATRAVTPTPTPTPPATGGVQSLGVFSGVAPGPFALLVQREDGSTLDIQGSLSTVMAALDAALAGVTQVDRLSIGTGTVQPASFSVSLAVDVDELTVVDDGCGTALGVSARRAILVRTRGCRSDISVRLAGIVGNGDRIGFLEVTGTESSVDVSAGDMENIAVGTPFRDSSGLRVGIHATSISEADISRCADCAVTIDGTISGGFGAGGNANLSLGSLTIGDVYRLSLQDNRFAGFGGISGGDIVIRPDRGDLTGTLTIFGNINLSLSAITIGDVKRDLNIQNNRGFSDDDAVAFRQARMVDGVVRIENNAP